MPARPGAGRPTDYDPRIHPQLAKWIARGGATDKEMAKEMGIAKSTLNRWKKEHPEFAEALRENKSFVDSLVEDSLLKRAVGFEYEETEITATPQGSGKDKDKQSKGRVKRVKRLVIPDVTAQIYWLNNRQPGRWRNRRMQDYDPLPTNLAEATTPVDGESPIDRQIRIAEAALLACAQGGDAKGVLHWQEQIRKLAMARSTIAKNQSTADVIAAQNQGGGSTTLEVNNGMPGVDCDAPEGEGE